MCHVHLSERERESAQYHNPGWIISSIGNKVLRCVVLCFRTWALLFVVSLDTWNSVSFSIEFFFGGNGYYRNDIKPSLTTLLFSLSLISKYTHTAALSEKDREYCRKLAETTNHLPAMCYTDKDSVNVVRRRTTGTKADPWAGAKGGKQGVENAKLIRRYTKSTEFKKWIYREWVCACVSTTRISFYNKVMDGSIGYYTMLMVLYM